MEEVEPDQVVEAESSDARTEDNLRVISVADFGTVDCEAPLADTKNVDCLTFLDLYRKAAEAAREGGNDTASHVYRLLSDVVQIQFKPEDRAEPYGPMLIMGDRRSIIPDDLRGEQSAAFAEIAPTTKNPGLRARLADIAWLNDRSLAGSASLAISSFCEAVRLVAEGKCEFFLEGQKASSHTGAAFLRRSCQIAGATGWREPEAGTLKSLIQDLLKRAFDERDAGGYLNIAKLSLDYGVVGSALVASHAEVLASAEALHPETARHLWELAARAHRIGDMTDDGNRCLVSAAECYVTMAAATGFKGMTAASWLMDAIKALRGVGGTKERREELETKLREAQASISDEMGVLSTKIDLSAIVDHSRKAVQGLTLAQALAEFAELDRSPAPDDLRKEALSNANENPLSSIVPTSIHDEEGKLVAKSPGMAGNEESENTATRHLIARNEQTRRQITAMGAIEPVRRVIFAEHPLHTRHFFPLAEMSPFVPTGHEDFYALGFARFFGGDLISATHILVPPLENSLRHVLKQVAIDPSSIQRDMTQENLTLSEMLKKNRAALEKIFGPAIIFEIENLFDFRGGPAMRHGIAHGLFPAGAFYSPDAIYACWFIFRLCCLPLFPRWNDVARLYENL